MIELFLLGSLSLVLVLSLQAWTASRETRRNRTALGRDRSG